MADSIYLSTSFCVFADRNEAHALKNQNTFHATRSPGTFFNIYHIPNPAIDSIGFQDWIKNVVEYNLKVSKENHELIFSFGEYVFRSFIETLPNTEQQYQRAIRFLSTKVFDEGRFQESFDLLNLLKKPEAFEKEELLGILFLLKKKEEYESYRPNIAWSGKGKQPKIIQKQKNRERVTLFGAVNPNTGEVIAKQANKGNAKTFKQFLKKILHHYKDSKGKIIIVLDNVKYHHAKSLKPFLEKHRLKLELMFLPAYSPDLNPIERVWWFMRKKITHNRYTETLTERMKAFWKMFSHYQIPNEEIIKICNISFSV